MKHVWASNVLRGLNLLLINALVLNGHYYKIRLRWSKMDFFKEIFGIIRSITDSCPRLGKVV